MRIGLPSRFGITLIIVLLTLGCGCNLYLAYLVPPHTIFNSVEIYERVPKRIAHLDEGALDVLGEAPYWYSTQNPTNRVYKSVSEDLSSWPQSGIHHAELGFPFVTRAVTNVIVLESAPTTKPYIDRDFVWLGSARSIGFRDSVLPSGAHDHERFFVSGLILNPIIYALPIWLIVMGIRWAFIARRSHKRERLGLCVACAYELGGLQTCPECGREG